MYVNKKTYLSSIFSQTKNLYYAKNQTFYYDFTSNIYIIIGNFTTLIAQSEAELFADSMVLTIEGQSMYNFYSQEPFDDGIDSSDAAELLTHYHFMSMFYDSIEPLHQHNTICYNSDFTLSEPSDNFLEGWDMYDGTRLRLEVNNFYSQLNFIPVPENAFPNYNFHDNSCHFDLDPNNNCPYINVTPAGQRRRLNFNAIEIYEGEDDKIISSLINTTTPKGNRSIRINNEYNFAHVNKIEKQFLVDTCEQFLTYSYAMILEDHEHTADFQPFFGAFLLDADNNVLEEKIYIADIYNECFEVFNHPNPVYDPFANETGLVISLI